MVQSTINTYREHLQASNGFEQLPYVSFRLIAFRPLHHCFAERRTVIWINLALRTVSSLSNYSRLQR